MRKGTIITALVAFLLLMPVIPGVMALPENLSVKTDRANYHPGEVVKVSGVATVHDTVNLEFKAGTDTITTANPTADENGNYHYNYNLPAEPYIGTWTIIATDSGKTAQASFIVFKAKTSEIALQLLTMTTNTMGIVSNQLEDTPIPPQAAQENYEAGVKALTEAQSLYDSAKYVTSIEASLRAQKHFANALRILAIGHPSQTIDDETRLTNQIERAKHMLDNLQRLYDNIKDKLTTENSGALNSALTDAQTEISNAEGELDDKEYAQAQTSLTNALDYMKTARTLLQDYACERKKEQILTFIDNAEVRIDKLEEAVETLRERIGNTEANTLLQKLEKVRTALKGLQQLVTDDATLKELNMQMKAIQDAIGELHNTAIKEALKEMDNMQAWIQLMKETRGIWMKKGLNTDGLNAKIHLGEETLGQCISELASGRKMGSRFPDIIQSFRDAFRNRGP